MSLKENAFHEDLKMCDTLQDIFDVCGKYYDLKNSRLGFASKTVVISGIKNAIRILKPPFK